MDLVDEHDGARLALDLLDHRLETLLEIAAIARSGKERAHVELVDGAVLQHIGNFAIDDAPGQALGDGGLADARVADEERIVLLPPAEDLDGAVHFAARGRSADRRGPRLLSC